MKPTGPKKPTRSKKPAGSRKAVGAGAIGLVVVCVLAATILIAARRPSQPADIATAEPQPEPAAVVEPTAKKVSVAQAQPTKKAAASKAPAANMVPANTLTPYATVTKGSAAESVTREPVGESGTKEPAAESAKSPAVESAAKAPAQESAVVTITGCLERHDGTLRLKDTEGVNAPKSRSWKSGFLKKGSASIDVVDAANRLKLSNYVGERVSLTGVLEDREMQAQSFQRIAAVCDYSK